MNYFSGKIDMIVIGAGTGGTVSGIARKLKEKIPNLKVCSFITIQDHKMIKEYRVLLCFFI